MDPKKFQIRIDNILGGHSKFSHMSSNDEYLDSLNIDPFAPANDVNPIKSYQSGILRPSGSANINNTSITVAIKWLARNPKTSDIFAYDSLGSVWTITPDSNGTPTTLTALSDAGLMSGGSGNGMAYYDNYMYFAKDTTVARYGPLNGTPTFDADYWVTTLSKTALIDTTYPSLAPSSLNVEYPNHILHRHSDGKLYFLDVVDNKGTVHYISTTKTTVEGDTDNSSKYNALQFGYGLWPTAIESYGTQLVFGLYEGLASQSIQMNAKIAFWDTTSQNFNNIVWVEFTDQVINSIKNINGVIYIISSNYGKSGYRLSQYIGGSSFKTIAYYYNGEAPMPGAVVRRGESLLFSIYSTQIETTLGGDSGKSMGPSITMYSQQLDAIFNIYNAGRTGAITAIELHTNSGSKNQLPVVANYSGSSSDNRISYQYYAESTPPSINYATSSGWWSRIYKIGNRFKITRIVLNFVNPIGSGMSVIPKVYIDNGLRGVTLETINNTRYSGKTRVELRPIGLVGDSSFWLSLTWDGSTGPTIIDLPIIIDYEIIPEE